MAQAPVHRLNLSTKKTCRSVPLSTAGTWETVGNQVLSSNCARQPRELHENFRCKMLMLCLFACRAQVRVCRPHSQYERGCLLQRILFRFHYCFNSKPKQLRPLCSYDKYVKKDASLKPTGYKERHNSVTLHRAPAFAVLRSGHIAELGSSGSRRQRSWAPGCLR